MLKTQRLYNQHITLLHDGNPATLLSHMGAIQGQDPVGAKWSLGLRLPHNTEAHIEQAIDNQTIVRTWLMRGTLFMIAARDLRWLLALVAPRVIQQSQRRYKQLELDETTLTQANEILARAVEDHQRIGRRDLYAILEQHGISTDGQRGFYIVRHASLNGHIVHGHVDGNDPVFTYFDDPADTLAPMPREEAIAKLARRYFASRGFATEADFAWWSGFVKKDIQQGIASIKNDLQAVEIDGTTHYTFTDSASIPPSQSPVVHALPSFDEYVLGYRDRDTILDKAYAKRVSRSGVFYSTIVIDGQIRGNWKATRKTHSVTVEITPFTTFSKAEKDAIQRAFARYSLFLDQPLNIVFL